MGIAALTPELNMRGVKLKNQLHLVWRLRTRAPIPLLSQ